MIPCGMPLLSLIRSLNRYASIGYLATSPTSFARVRDRRVPVRPLVLTGVPDHRPTHLRPPVAQGTRPSSLGPSAGSAGWSAGARCAMMRLQNQAGVIVKRTTVLVVAAILLVLSGCSRS